MKIQFGSGSTTGAAGRSAGGKGCLTVFFLVFLVMGSLFAILIVGEAVQETLVWFWSETPCTILIGPEGGLSETERESAYKKGYEGIQLGPRVLRTDNAALGALAAIQSRWGDL